MAKICMIHALNCNTPHVLEKVLDFGDEASTWHGNVADHCLEKQKGLLTLTDIARDKRFVFVGRTGPF